MAAVRLDRRQDAPPGTFMINGTAVPLSQLPHNNLGPQLNFTIWLLTGLSAGFMALRIYCKCLRSRGLWWDDYILLVSWFALATSAAFTTASVSFGFGQHLWDVNPQDFIPLNLVAIIAGFFSILAAMWSKTSFALTLLRISQPWMKKAIWVIIITLNAVMGASALIQWIHCMPVKKSWDSQVEGTCWPNRIVVTYYQFTTLYSGAMDLILALFPWTIVMKLRMTRSEKLGVAFAMSMGVFAGLASIIKFTKVSTLGGDPVDTVALVSWGIAESAITIIAASIPILRALVRERPPPFADFGTADEKILASPLPAPMPTTTGQEGASNTPQRPERPDNSF